VRANQEESVRSKHFRRVTVIVAALVATSVLGVGFGGTVGAGGQPSGEPIKFGYIEPFPGESMQPGIIEALEAYFDDWNDRGGFNGRPVDLVVEIPTGLSADAFIAAVNKLVDEEGVVALLAAGYCDLSLNALRAKQVGTFGATDVCGKDDNDFFFATSGRATTLPMLQFAINDGSKNFAVAYPSGIPGLKEGFVDPLADYLELNPDIDTNLIDVPMPFPATAADWDAAIQKMKDEEVDAMFVAVQPDGGVLGLTEARVQGFGPEDGIQWIFGPNFYDPDLATEPAFEGTFSLAITYPWEDTTNKQVKKMNKVLKGEISKQDGFTASGYQIGAELEQALKGLKGEVTVDSVKAQMAKQHKFKLPLTPVKLDFTNLGKNPAYGLIMQVDGGVWVPASEFLVIPGKDFTK
jgi:branched-chain amino acid transport system substrate-binding protein